jgi:hypothetical protein
MLYGISALCFLLAGYSAFMSLSDRMQYGSWYAPHWTIGGTFGIDERLFGNIGADVSKMNAGYIFLALSLVVLAFALLRHSR